MTLQFADRLNNVETSAIRELFKLLGKPGIISFAGGFPDSAMFDVQGIREASNAALDQDAGAALQYGATEGFNPLREQLAHFMAQKGARTLSSVAGMRPALRYCAAVAWAKVLVCASLNCLHMVARASNSAGPTIQPTRRPGDSTLDKEPQCTKSSRLPGTKGLIASRLGGGASPKYRSAYGSSSTIKVWCFTAISST